MTASRKTKGRRGRPFLLALSGAPPRLQSVARGWRTAPAAEAVVHADLDGMVVLPAARADDIGRTGGEGGVAEIIVLVLGLGRPVRREHVFEARANGVTVFPVAGRGEGGGRPACADAEVVVAPGVAALGIEQRRAPGVADAAGYRAELVGVGGYQRARRKQDTVPGAGQPGILGLQTHYPIGRELVVEAALDTAKEACVVAPERIVAGKRSTNMTADIEAGPVIDHLRRGIGRSLGVRARRNVGCRGRCCQRKQGDCAEQVRLHGSIPVISKFTLSKQRDPNLVASRQWVNADRSVL